MSGKRKRQAIQARRQRKAERKAALDGSPCWDALIASGSVIPADLSQQAPNNSYDPPRFYRDREFTCVDCGRAEVWTARQQKWWYEVAKGSIYSAAIRCRDCRRRRREQQGRGEGASGTPS